MSASVNPIVKQILVSRGYDKPDELKRFMNPDYEKDLHDPLLLTDMKAAVKRILEAVKSKQKIVIYGDYDIDGITASAVMIETIKNLGHQAASYIPDRFEEGYGLNQTALKALKKDGVELIITVDCGVTSVSEVEWANKNGLDVIITDHHNVPPVIPKALAVINPKRPDDKYPFKDLAGVGVAFKLAQALQQTSGKPEKGQEKWLLDLVALGTVCDVVPLVGENRVLAKFGLLVMAKTRRPGIKALAAVGGVEGALNSYHLGWVLGPRLNAAGRLEHARHSLELIHTADSSRAMELAAELHELNKQRLADQKRIIAEAEEQAKLYVDDPVLVLADEGWSHGIVGIVAGRLADKFHKPTLVMQILGDTTKGSARSTGRFNIVDGLRAADKHLIKYGGHFFAAGCTLKTKDIDKLRQILNKQAAKEGLGVEEADERKEPDARLTDFSKLDWELYKALEAFEPHGHGNPRPILSTDAKVAALRKVGVDQTHLKLTLADSQGNLFEGIGFGLVEKHSNLKPGQSVQVHYNLSKNEYNGNSNLQLLVTDLMNE
ncbi:MAG TPA: single-stranded-DNA-specific exonuclease RecJ [Candidatus Nanoarchaeia archaeon]|nr:single-stranded-DNA-specific exonuclease RecJ [Candidatus Nanoarchaeia archaeon]